jgi:hypothetical protein
MFTPAVRYILIGLGLALSAVFFAKGRWVGLFPLLAVGLLVYGHFRFGTVGLAFRALRQGDMERAETLLRKVADPEKLNPQARAYHDWIKGVVTTARGELEQARPYLESAVGGALRTSNDRSLALCCLAEVAAKSGNRGEAGEILERARAEPHTPSVDQVIANIETLMRK